MGVTIGTIISLMIFGWLFLLIAVFLGGWIALKAGAGKSLLSKIPSGDATNLEDIYDQPQEPPEMPAGLAAANERFREQYDPGQSMFGKPPVFRPVSVPVEDENGYIKESESKR